jgi:hypothetical protein
LTQVVLLHEVEEAVLLPAPPAEREADPSNYRWALRDVRGGHHKHIFLRMPTANNKAMAAVCAKLDALPRVRDMECYNCGCKRAGARHPIRD